MMIIVLRSNLFREGFFFDPPEGAGARPEVREEPAADGLVLIDEEFLL